MRILFIDKLHHKNRNFILKCKKIQFVFVDNIDSLVNYNFNDFDAVFSPSNPIDVSKYPKTKFIFGPHFSVFANEMMYKIAFKNSVYNTLSDWNYRIWSQSYFCKGVNIVTLPFGVDTDKFTETKPISERDKVLVYYKHRKEEEIQYIEKYLKNRNIDFSIYCYGYYNENDYLKYLQESKYAIIVDAHESQGFAIEEALSCNVPLLVWNVKYMSQEIAQNHSDHPANSIPYWSDVCGEYFFEEHEFEWKFNLFLSKLNTYTPRKYILDNLSIDVCEDRFIKLIENMSTIT